MPLFDDVAATAIRIRGSYLGIEFPDVVVEEAANAARSVAPDKPIGAVIDAMVDVITAAEERMAIPGFDGMTI